LQFIQQNLSIQITLKLGVILESKKYEKAWNAFRFSVTAKKAGHEVKLLLMGEAVECEGFRCDWRCHCIAWHGLDHVCAEKLLIFLNQKCEKEQHIKINIPLNHIFFTISI